MNIEDFFNFEYIYFVLGIFLILVCLCIYFAFKQKKRLDIFFQRGEKDLEKVLTEQIKKTEKIENNLKEISEQISKLETISQKSFQKIGIIRFNPFKEVGGDQSFAIALLDLNNNGFVITSHYSRESSRVYNKEVKNGKSKYSLSNEEKKAIEKAITEVY
ncbi:DUF4446 family protein [Candidatus Parcubacteria bacterium]|nr:DUF4446 family protein [Candidatus Parcubacteria bacterium]